MTRNRGGNTPWSSRLLFLSRSLTDRERTVRAFTVQTSGAVGPIEVRPGVLAATVRGSRPTPYHTELHCPVLTGRANRVATNLAEVVPADDPWTLATDLDEQGIEIVPDRAELSHSCTCPDASSVCKHAVALLIDFAAVIDDIPARMLQWRGVLTAEVRAERAERGGDHPAGRVIPPELRAGLPGVTTLGDLARQGDTIGGPGRALVVTDAFAGAGLADPLRLVADLPVPDPLPDCPELLELSGGIMLGDLVDDARRFLAEWWPAP